MHPTLTLSTPGDVGVSALMRDNSVHAVLNVLSEEPHTFSITELCRMSELSRPTVTRILNDLMVEDLVHTKTATRSHATGGRKPQLFSLNRKHHCSVVLRVNYDVVEGFALDAAGDVLTDVSDRFADHGEVTEHLADVLRKILNDTQCPVFSAAVVVMGIVHRGRVVRSESFPMLNDNLWIDRLNEILREHGHEAQVVALNDAKVAAQWMYDQLATPEGGPDSMIALHCSEDLGCGLIFDGVLLDGAHGAAGEILQETDGEWTTVSKYLRALESEHGMSIRQLFAAAPALDRDTPFVHTLGTLIGKALVPMVLTLDPDMAAVGGAIVDCGTPLIQAIEAELNKATPTPPLVSMAPQGAKSVKEGAKMFVLAQARNATMGLLNGSSRA
ncbi:ROK family transcriptional regulator [Trueperella pyogenes]|uniref:ROK family transcriptional regulator n=1 Tax=Trueperella pyogenes TaxID=1661 RepID=UPI001670937B|nr:ROK family transcriptional regulator [Trueperella pyogenes]